MIYEPYSRRMKNAAEDKSDVYTYDKIPLKFRNQVIYIAEDVLFNSDWEEIRTIMVRELGVVNLAVSKGCYKYTAKEECQVFIRNCKEYENVLDIIELIARVISIKLQYDNKRLEEVIKELNYRFKDNDLGYQFINDELIRVDNELIHKDIIKPAIKLLYDEDFKGVCKEFFEAHDDYRNQKYESAITNVEKAFESTMKTICEKLNYKYDKERDNASTLIGRLQTNNFIPKYEQAGFNDLNNLMKNLKNSLGNNLPVIRNKISAHGAGVEVRQVSEYIVEYAINMCATNIVYLVKTYQEKKNKLEERRE